MKPWSALLDALQGDMSGSKIQGAEKLKAYLSEWQASMKDGSISSADLEPMMDEYIAALGDVYGSDSRPPAEYSLKQLRNVNENDVKMKVEHMVGLLGPFSMSVQTKTELEKLIRMFLRLVAKNREMRLQHARMSVIVPAYIVNFSKLLRETTEQSVATHFVVDKYQNVVMEELFTLLGKEGDGMRDPESERVLTDLQKLISEIKRITERDQERGARYAQELLQKADESVILKLAKGEDVMSDKIRVVLQSLHPKPSTTEIAMLDVLPDYYSALYGLYFGSAQQAQASGMESPESYEQRYTKKIKLARLFQPPDELVKPSPATLELHPDYAEMLMQLWTPQSKDWISLDTYRSAYMNKWGQSGIPPEQIVPCITLWLTLRDLYQRPVGMLSDRLYKFMYDALRVVSSPLVKLVNITDLASLTKQVAELTKYVANNANASGMSRANDLMKVCEELANFLKYPLTEDYARVYKISSKLPEAMPADGAVDVAEVGKVTIEAGGEDCSSVKLTLRGVTLTIERGVVIASKTDDIDTLFDLTDVAYAVAIKPALTKTRIACALRSWVRALPIQDELDQALDEQVTTYRRQMSSQKKKQTTNGANTKQNATLRSSQTDSESQVTAEIRLKPAPGSKTSAPSTDPASKVYYANAKGGLHNAPSTDPASKVYYANAKGGLHNAPSTDPASNAAQKPNTKVGVRNNAPSIPKRRRAPAWQDLRPPQESLNGKSMFGKTNAAPVSPSSVPRVNNLWAQQQKTPNTLSSPVSTSSSANPTVNPLWQQRSSASAFSPAQQPSQQELLPGLFGRSKAFDKGLGPIKSALQESAPFTVPIFNMFGHALGQAGKSISSALANRVASGVYDMTNKTVDSINKFGSAGTQYVAGSVASGIDATNKTVDSINKFGRAGTQYVAGGPPKSA
jgi:hypothetical protein